MQKPARNEYFRGKDLVVPGDELRKIEKIIYRKLGEVQSYPSCIKVKSSFLHLYRFLDLDSKGINKL